MNYDAEYEIYCFYNNVRYLAKKNKIKLKDFEREIGVSQGYFSRNKGSVSLRIACKTANCLNVTLNDLLCDELIKSEKVKQLEEEIERLNNELRAIKEGEK